MLLLYILFATSAAQAAVDYTGQKVLRITPTHDDHMKWLNDIGRQEHYKMWKEPTALGNPVDIMVHPSKLELLQASLRHLGMDHHVTVDDVQRMIDTSKTPKKKTEENFTTYMSYSEMEGWLNYAVGACGAKCQLINIGQSYEGRDMWVFKISTGGGKRGVWIDSGIHAREWIAHHTGLYIIDRFVFDFGVDPDVAEILNNYDVYILPVVNPDGYVYSWTTDRLWRKTRNPHDNDNTNPCVGADCNRNYDFMWSTIGASDQPCDETFAGPYAHSEPESANQRDFIFTMEGNWEVFLTLHTFGQLWMAPWGYTEDDPSNYDELMRVGHIGADALTAVHGTQYVVGSAADILYESSGTSRDWAAGHARTQIPYVYTLELRDKNSFVLPDSEIIPTGQETWAGFKAMMFAINPGNPKK